MIKNIPKLLWAFDCEWIPDTSVGRKVYNLQSDLSEQQVLEVMWKEGGATPENPQPFLKLIVSKIVSIAILSREATDNGDVKLELHSLPKEDEVLTEKEIIERFLNGIGKKQPQLVGFNSFDSDLPILLQRGLVNGITAPQFSKRPNKPWEGFDYFSKSSEAHLDIKNIIGTWGKGNPSLHELAVSSGIPGKLGTSGDQVLDLYKQGKINEIVAYNECDSITTYLVWLRMAYFSGLLDSKKYEREQETLEELLNYLISEGKTHLQVFLDKWRELKL